jgi:chromosome partitioning protein
VPIAAIVSGKGGVTKTTTAYALAAALRELDVDSTLVDLDPGASLTEAAGLIPDGSHAVDLLTDKAPIEKLLVETNDGILIVPGTAATLNTSTEKKELIGYAERLRAAGSDRLLVIDTAQGLALGATRAAMLAADFLVIPMQAEPAVIRRSYPDVLAMMRVFLKDPELKTRFRVDPELLFVMTKFNGRLKLSELQLSTIAKDGIQVAAYVPEGVAAKECCLVGKSVVTYAPRSPITAGYRNLARTLVASLNRGKSSVA